MRRSGRTDTTIDVPALVRSADDGSGGDAGVDDPTEEIAASAESLWETALDALPRLGVAVAIVAGGWAASRLLRWTMHRVWRRRQTPSFAQVMSKLAGWLLLFVVVLLAITVTFPSVRPVDVLAGLGFFSVAVGFAFQDILENSLSGVLLLFRQPFRGGDQIEVGDHVGTVEGITIRETRIRNFDGELIVIPNRDVYKNSIVVLTEQPIHRQTVTVGVDYASDLDLVRRVALEAVASVAGVRADPAPLAQFGGLSASTIDVDVRFWTDARQADTLAVRDAAIAAVIEAMRQHDVVLPAPIVELDARRGFTAALRATLGR